MKPCERSRFKSNNGEINLSNMDSYQLVFFVGGMLGQSHRSSIVLEVGSSQSHVRRCIKRSQFWIPNEANEPTHMETEAGGAESEHPPQ
ncbi:hypothetical protein ACFX1S_023669 [Malus domestica]